MTQSRAHSGSPTHPPTSGRVALIAGPTTRDQHAETLMRAGYDVYGFDDPYDAMLAICRKPLVFRAVTLSLQGIYLQELAIIPVISRRYPHMRLVACDTHGRRAAFDRARELGVTDQLDGGGIRPVENAKKRDPGTVRLSNASTDLPMPPGLTSAEAAALAEPIDDGPLLTPEELRALLNGGH